MSRQQYDDSFDLLRRENLSYGAEGYSNLNMNNGSSFRMSGGQNISFGNQVLPDEYVNRFDYGHQSYDTRPVQGQLYDNVQMSQFGNDYDRRNIGDLRVNEFQDNRRIDSEVTGTNWGHSDQISMPFDAQISSRRDILPEPSMSRDIDRFETRSFDSPRLLPERESIKTHQTSSSSFRSRHHDMKRSSDDRSQRSSSKPKYRRMGQSSSAPVKKNIKKSAPTAKHTTTPKQQSTTTTTTSSSSSSSALHKKTDQKPNSSVPLKIDPKTNVPRQPLGKIDKNTVNVEKSASTSNTPSTSKTVDCVKSMEKIDECPWLNAEEVTEEELRLKFPDKLFEMFEESCLSNKGDLNIKENLPEGWTATFHVTGFPVYLHKPTAVVTLSKPYELGSLNLRTHMFPVASIPCLQYTRKKKRNSLSQLDDDKKTTSKLIPKDKGAEFVQAHPEYKRKMAERGGLIEETEKKEAKDTKTESHTDNPTNIIPSNLDKETMDAFLQFQEELENEMKQANKSLNEEEEYERQMLNTFFEYQEDIDDPDTEEPEKQSEEKVKETVDHEEFLKYCERLFEFDTVKLAVQKDSDAKSNKTYYCLGREKRQVKTSDQGLTTVQSRPEVNSTGSKDGQQSTSRNDVYKDDRTEPTPKKGNYLKNKMKKAEKLGSVKPIPTLITRAGASEPLTSEVAPTSQVSLENPITILKSYVSTTDSVYEPRYSMIEIAGYRRLKCCNLYFGNVKFATGFGKNPSTARKRAAFIGLCMLLPAKYKMGQIQDYVPATDKAFDDLTMFDNIKITELELPYLCDTVKRMNPYDMLELIADKCGIKSSEIRFRYVIASQYTWRYMLTVGYPKKWESVAISFNKYQGRQKAAQIILQTIHPNMKYGQLLEEYGQKNVIKSSHLIDMGNSGLPKEITSDQPRYRQCIIECLQTLRVTEGHETEGMSLDDMLIVIRSRKGMTLLTRKTLNKRVEELMTDGIIKEISKNKVVLEDDFDIKKMQI